MKQVLLIGGTSVQRQLEQLKKKPQIVVGTPGRIAEVIESKKLKVDKIHTIVIDEADKMADELFNEEVSGLIKFLPKEAQMLLFSATKAIEAEFLLKENREDYKIILLSKSLINTDIDHSFVMTDDPRKFDTFLRLQSAAKIEKAIMFITRNAGVNGLVKRLREKGLSAEGLHSGMDSDIRKRVINDFIKGKIKYLITTDILARGIDVPDVEYIINYDLPKDYVTYIHRAGRTARAGRKGTVISLVEEDKKFVIRKYERRLDIKIYEKGFNKEGRLIDVQY